jgi:hypothetical protein
VRTQVRVVKEAGLEPSLRVRSGQRFQGAEAQGLFQCPPQPFHDRDGAGLADGAEALADAEFLQAGVEGLGGELRSLVGDEVSGTPWEEAPRLGMRFSFRTLPTVLGETLQPARASVWAMVSLPPKPVSSGCWMRWRVTSS